MVTYKPVTELTPLVFNYEFYKNENLLHNFYISKSGYQFLNFFGLKGFKDIQINHNSCYILTSAISLSSLFSINNTDLKVGKIPGSITIQSQQTITKYASLDEVNNTIILTDIPDIFFINPIDNNEIEIKVKNYYLQVDGEYPYRVRFSEQPLTGEQTHRQRFIYTYNNNILTLKTLTNAGFRYLSFTNKGTLRATGLILNIAPLQNYALLALPVTPNILNYNFTSRNNWITYYQDFVSQKNNETLEINKTFEHTPINFLINFPFKQIKNNQIFANIANLKTVFTPAGGPAPVDNTYTEETITTN